MSAAIAGRKMITGTAGCTRERASSTRESNIGGEARSTSVLLPGRSLMSSASAQLIGADVITLAALA
jgi:hypothetical protein